MNMETAGFAFDRESRLRYAKVDENTGRLLRAFWKTLKNDLPKILDAFYNHVGSEPELAKLVGGRSSALKAAQTSHWERLFEGHFDQNYMESVYRIGLAHKKIGLEPRWYIAGYKFVLNEIVEVVCRNNRFTPWRIAPTVRAVNTALMLDVDLAISTYFAEMTREIVESVGNGLDALAHGDLTHRVTIELSASFAKLKSDFNNAVGRVQETMQSVMGATSGISTGAAEISQASDDLSRRTEQQAASLEETAAALEEITATVKKTATNAHEASAIVRNAKAAATEGGQVVENAIEAMGAIEQSSKQITDIIGVIDEIAFQTNLLALNAGVEAARAGDAGKGFAVVASEVRALAQRSSEAAKEIKSLIKASSEHVGSGVKLVDESGRALKKIVEQVVEINTLVSEMAQAAQQQSTGIEEVNTAVTQMDQVTQQNAAMVEESTAAARNLAGETDELSKLVSFFNVGAPPPARKAIAAASPQPAKIQPRAARAATQKSAFSSSGGRRAGTALAAAPQENADEDWQEF